jgi:hypothetical protein
MKQDLGTYHVRVELEDGRGWIDRWNTAARFSKGTEHCAPLEAVRLAPVFESEEHLIGTIVFNFFDGNGSCDCNKKLALAAAYNLGDAWDEECGDTMPIAKLTLIRPDGSEKTIYPEL